MASWHSLRRMSIATPRFPRFRLAYVRDSFGTSSRKRRQGSPSIGSNLMHSAPISARCMPQNGPAMICVNSRTFTPESGPEAMKVSPRAHSSEERSAESDRDDESEQRTQCRANGAIRETPQGMARADRAAGERNGATGAEIIQRASTTAIVCAREAHEPPAPPAEGHEHD